MEGRAEERIGNNLFLSFSSKVNQIELTLYEFRSPRIPSASTPLPAAPSPSSPPPPSDLQIKKKKTVSDFGIAFVALVQPGVGCRVCILKANLNSFNISQRLNMAFPPPA